MTNHITIGGLLSIEEEHGQFKFMARGGWPVTYFSLAHLDEMLVLLQQLQQEMTTHAVPPPREEAKI